MTQRQLEVKKEQGHSLEQVQNPLKNLMQDMERDLELNQNFFLCDKVNREKIFLKKKMKKHGSSGKSYSLRKVKSQNFLANISYNHLKSIDFNNATFIIDCYTYIMLNRKPFFLERKFEDKIDREFVETL